MLLVYVNSIDVCLLILLSRTSWLTLGLRVYRFSWIFNAIYLQTSIVCFPPPIITTLSLSSPISWMHCLKVKVTQLCPTLCNPMDYTVHGIPQARILEWVAHPSPVDLPDPGIKPRSSALQADSLAAELPGIYIYVCVYICSFFPPLLQLCPCPHLFLGCIA